MVSLNEIYQVESFYMGMEDPYTGDDDDYEDEEMIEEVIPEIDDDEDDETE